MLFTTSEQRERKTLQNMSTFA